MSAPTDVWRYIASTWGGLADLLRRRGWEVGQPVYLPFADYKWQHPCVRRGLDS